jgi:putative membrane protein
LRRFLKYLLVSWLGNAIVLGVVAALFAGVVVGKWWQLLEAAAIFGILNTVVKPLLRLLTLPIAVVTLGIAWFFVSMLMLVITDWLVKGFDIHGFWTLVWSTVAVWAVNVVLEILTIPWRRRGSHSPAMA